MNETGRKMIYDWNLQGKVVAKPPYEIEFDDETLRDGLQGPSVTNPTIEQKIEILHLMEGLGITAADIGLPGAGPHVVEHVTRLAREAVDHKMKIQVSCAGRTVVADIEPIVEISQKVGIPITADLFIGSSPIRQYVEGWTLEDILKHTREAVTFAVKHGIPVMYVTEDTSRAAPETVRALYTEAIECGATQICVCDTVGHSTPHGARELVSFVKNEIVEKTNPDVKINWHGHQDRGLGVINTLAAIEGGAKRVHGTALGIGERAGNTPMDQLLANLQLMGWIDKDLTKLPEYCRTVSKATGMPIPRNYPVIGRDAFETGTGVHAAAVIKAFDKGDDWLANRVYSGVPADQFGLKQVILVGPMSGRSNVVHWLKTHGHEPTEELVDRVFQAAKKSNRNLTDDEIQAVVDGKKAAVESKT